MEIHWNPLWAMGPQTGFHHLPTDFQTTPFDPKLFFLKKTLQNAGNTSNKQIPRFIALAEPVRRCRKCRSWSNFGKNQWNPYCDTIQPYRGLWWDLVGKSIKTHWKTCKIDPEASQVVSNHPECFARSYFIVLCPWGVCRARKPRKPEILHDFFWKKNINPGEYCSQYYTTRSRRGRSRCREPRKSRILRNFWFGNKYQPGWVL